MCGKLASEGNHMAQKQTTYKQEIRTSSSVKSHIHTVYVSSFVSPLCCSLVGRTTASVKIPIHLCLLSLCCLQPIPVHPPDVHKSQYQSDSPAHLSSVPAHLTFPAHSNTCCQFPPFPSQQLHARLSAYVPVWLPATLYLVTYCLSSCVSLLGVLSACVASILCDKSYWSLHPVITGKANSNSQRSFGKC